MAEFNRYSTVGDILNGAAVECGLAPLTDPFASTDPSFVQLRYLLTTCGRELIGAHQWQQLRREASISVVASGAAEFALEDDFDRFIDQTKWDRTNDEQVIGPLSAQDWQRFKGEPVDVALDYIYWRYDADRIKVYPDPPTVTGTIYYEYVSRAWVQDGTVSTTYRDYPAALADVVLYDSTLMIKMLALRFLGAKGFDTTNITQQFNTAFNFAINANTPGQILTVAPCGRSNDQPWSGSIAGGLPA